jgi:hypothetical protein
MQIHELTKRNKRTDEGILDGIKSAISAAQTGFNAGKMNAPGDYAKYAGAAGAAGALTSPAAAAVAGEKTALDAAEKSRQAINKKLGLTGTDKEIKGATRAAGDLTAASTLDKQAQANQQQVQQQAQAMTQQFVQTPDFEDLGQVLPDPGQMLTVTLNGGQYFKDENGTWYAEPASNIDKPAPITADNTIKALNGVIDTDQYKQVPSILAAGAPVQKEAAGNFNRRALAMKQTKDLIAKKVVPIAIKNKVDPKKAFGTPEAKKAFDQLTKIAQMPYSKIKSTKTKKQKIKQAFTNYATATLNGALGQQAQPGQSNQVGNNQAGNTQRVANPADRMGAQQIAIKQGIDPKALTAMEKMVQQGKGDIVKQAVGLDESRKSLEQRLTEALNLLNETQVYITKDIHVRTPKGDYIKRASDQTWYDPNGVPIDPVKYADYIKKLDATPMAQTRYQADAKNAKGSDSALIKQQAANQAAAKAPTQVPAPQAAPDPLQQMADQERMQAILRNRDVAGLNSMIQDTFNQLQNAKIFNTGQEDYLNDRMKALMAMKA